MSNTKSTYWPGRIVAQRVRQARRRRGWSQGELAARLTELGHTIAQPAIARLESDKRAVPIDELFALAAALEVAPVHLLTPLDDEAQVAVTPNRTVPAPLARAWLRGQAVLPGAGINWSELPESELRRDVRRLVVEKLTRGMSPIARALTEEKLSQEAERLVEAIVDAMRNPKEDDDG